MAHILSVAVGDRFGILVAGAQLHRVSTPEVGFSKMNNGVETWSLIQLCLLDMFRIRRSSLEVKTLMQSCNSGSRHTTSVSWMTRTGSCKRTELTSSKLFSRETVASVPHTQQDYRQVL